MDKDIEFALGILRNEYKERREVLVNKDLNSKRKDNILTDLEIIIAGINKIESKFKEGC